jgi:spore germination cell wall hydrolase CwlJ-like protein
MKLSSVAAGFVNGAIVASMVAVGVVKAQEAEAQERLRTISTEDRECLAQNIYHEARGETIAGQVAVAWVTLNRMEADKFPNTLCGVVKQARTDSNGNPLRNKCQFSWYCDGKSDRIRNQREWEDVQLITNVVLIDWARAKSSPVEDATFYHADYVKPYWASAFTQVAQVDSHIFYVEE